MNPAPSRRSASGWPEATACARRLAQAAQQDDAAGGERGGEAECGRGAGPAHQRAGHRGPAHEGGGARQLEPGVGRGQSFRRHQRRHERRRGDAVGHRPARAREAQQREPRERQQPGLGEQERHDQRARPHRLGHRHEATAGHAIGQQARRDGQDQERQRLRGLEEPGLAGTGAEREHRHQRRRGESDLLGGLRGQVRPGQAGEAGCALHAPVYGAAGADGWKGQPRPAYRLTLARISRTSSLWRAITRVTSQLTAWNGHAIGRSTSTMRTTRRSGLVL